MKRNNLDIKKRILEILGQIEKERGIKILMAVESGSREWGFASEDSDWDVRCVHVSPEESYLSLNPPKDQIELMEGDIDVVSWDIRKFFSLLLNTNPTVSEWLCSNQVYVSKSLSGYDKEILKKLFREGFNRERLEKHYLSLARQNYEKYIRKDSKVLLKKYIYLLRALGCIKYIQKTGDIPPLNWKESSIYLPKSIVGHFQNLIEMKHKSESTKALRIKELDDFIESMFAQPINPGKETFNKELIDSIVINAIKTKK